MSFIQAMQFASVFFFFSFDQSYSIKKIVQETHLSSGKAS